MKVLRILTLAVIALLMLVIVVDRWRAPEQMRKLVESTDALRASIEQQTQENRLLRQEMLARPVEQPSATAGSATSGTAAVATTAESKRDGRPTLGVNFLLPYDRSWFHPEWLKGTTRGFGETAKGFNLILENSATSHDVHDRVTDSLCNQWPATAQQWTEGLATSAVITDDYKTYTLTIRKGVIWQRPRLAKRSEFAWLDKDVELTAHDFVFFLNLVKAPEVECPELRNYYDDLEKAEAVDDYTLRLTWKRKVYTSVTYSLGLNPLPRHVYTRNRDGSEIPQKQVPVVFNKHWFDEEKEVIGVGPYTLSEYEPDKVTRFKRNPRYWGAPLHFESFEWQLDVKKSDPMLVAFKNGQVNSYSLDPAQYKSQILDHNEPRFAKLDPANPKAGRSGELGWEKVKTNAYTYIGWNMRSALFSDRAVRRAMSHAFPRERIIREVYHGLGETVESDIHPDNDYAKGLKLEPFAFDLKRSSELLKEAGWADSDGDGWLDKTVAGQRVPLR
nr:hypothetical protein [Planctomycetota bacterium]